MRRLAQEPPQRRSHRSFGAAALFVAAAALIAAVAGAANGAITLDNPVIRACYTPAAPAASWDPQPRQYLYYLGRSTVDGNAGPCESGDHAISWIKKGPTGERGARGRRGRDGATGAQGPQGDRKAPPGAWLGTVEYDTDTQNVKHWHVVLPCGNGEAISGGASVVHGVIGHENLTISQPTNDGHSWEVRAERDSNTDYTDWGLHVRAVCMHFTGNGG
jgi:hypothetical protein